MSRRPQKENAHAEKTLETVVGLSANKQEYLIVHAAIVLTPSYITPHMTLFPQFFFAYLLVINAQTCIIHIFIIFAKKIIIQMNKEKPLDFKSHSNIVENGGKGTMRSFSNFDFILFFSNGIKILKGASGTEEDACFRVNREDHVIMILDLDLKA